MADALTGPADGAILRLEMDIFPNGHINLRSVCEARADFDAVTNAFRAAARDIGAQIKERTRCPFHPDHPDNPVRVHAPSS